MMGRTALSSPRRSLQERMHAVIKFADIKTNFFRGPTLQIYIEFPALSLQYDSEGRIHPPVVKVLK